MPAISAIAESYSIALRGQYLAGLWSNFLFGGLLWRVSETILSKPVERPTSKYRAPSWSWASVDSMVISGGHGHSATDKATIISYEVILASQDPPFGEVIGGELVVEGMLAKATQENQEILWR